MRLSYSKVTLVLAFLPLVVQGLLSTNNFVIERKISGLGFHRNLETNIHMPSKLHRHLSAPGCSLLMFQVLPSGVYADSFQVKSLEPFGFPKVLFDRKVDIEAAEYASKPHELFIFIHLDDYEVEKTTGHLNIDISLPIHARYHKPLSWLTSSESYAKISILHPGLYSNCSDADGHNTLKAPCDQSNSSSCSWAHVPYISYSPQVEMGVPVGRERDKPLVVTATLVVTTAVCALILKSVCSAQSDDLATLKVS